VDGDSVRAEERGGLLDRPQDPVAALVVGAESAPRDDVGALRLGLRLGPPDRGDLPDRRREIHQNIVS
jgi:hypothetical protein